MWKAALAGAMLAATGPTFCLAQDYNSTNYEESQSARRGPVVTAGHIAGLRAALRLTSEQQRHWPAVASALRAISGRSANADAVSRVISAAQPLINSLTDQQRQAGMRVIRASGFSSLAAAL